MPIVTTIKLCPYATDRLFNKLDFLFSPFAIFFFFLSQIRCDNLLLFLFIASLIAKFFSSG